MSTHIHSENFDNGEDSRGDTRPLFWYFRPNPGEHAFAQDQEPPSKRTCLAFKSTLIANEARSSQTRLVLNPNLPCTQELQTRNSKSSWPLSWFQDAIALPTAEELAVFQTTCISRWGNHCSILTTLNDQEKSMTRPPVRLAIESLGATLVDSSHHKDIWVHANRMLIVGFATNNQMTRNHYAYLAWILNDIAAAVTSNPEILRLANMTHGMIKTAMRRRWQAQQIQSDGHRHGPTLGSLLLSLLQADLVRSLRMHTSPTTISAFGSVPLEMIPQTNLKDLVTYVFNPREAEWTFESPELVFLKLLIILNEIVIYALVVTRLHGNKPVPTGAIMSLSASEEMKRVSIRIQNALSRWYVGCYAQIGPQVRALYHFCRIYVLLPRLHLLPSDAKDSISVDLPATSKTSHIRQPCIDSSTRPYPSSSTTETIHHAWLLYEAVTGVRSNSPPLDSLYLPIITFLAGLCIWESIVKEEGSRVQGSMKVLRLFSIEIRRMPWPCCREMAGFLDSLT